MSKAFSGASALAPLPDGDTAGELIHQLVRHRVQLLIEVEGAAVVEAERHDRTDQLLGHRNSSRPRLLTTQVGVVPPLIPKPCSGSFYQVPLAQGLYGLIMRFMR